MLVRSRSESPLVRSGNGLSWQDPGRPDLFSAIAARKRADQDALLLANRIRLLRTEDQKTRKRVHETERKTHELLELRRRNDSCRALKEVECSQREVQEQDTRERHCREREEQQRKICDRRKMVMEHKLGQSTATKQEREAARQFLQDQRAQTEVEQQARAERVRSQAAAASKSRARSEGARQEMVKNGIKERLCAEEEQRLARLAEIKRMECEEAKLLVQLQKTREQHRNVFMRLEDTMQQSGFGGRVLASTTMTPVARRATPISRSSSQSSLVPLHPVTPQGAVPSGMSLDGPELRIPAMGGGVTVGAASRPPRPQGDRCTGSSAQALLPSPSAVAGMAAVRNRPGSASHAATRSTSTGTPTTANSGRKGSIGAGSQGGCSRSGSSCSTTASGGCHGADLAENSRSNTPSKPKKHQPSTYTTVDGLTLDVAQEEDVDLAALLAGP